MADRPRPRSLDKIDELDVVRNVDLRGDYRTAGRFRRRLWNHMRFDQQRAKNLAALVLRTLHGFLPNEVGLIFGRSGSGATDMIREARAELPRSLSEHFDHRTDCVAAIQVADAETLVNRIKQMRHMFAADDAALDAAVENLSSALTRRYADDD